MNNDNKEHGWVTVYDKYGDATGTLAGNKVGLEILKEKIDSALKNGEVAIEPELGGDFFEIRLAEQNPQNEYVETPKDNVIKFGCILVLAAFLVVLGFGIKGIYDYLF